MSPISDVVLVAGVSRLTAIERSNLAVAQKFHRFSASNPLTGELAVSSPTTPATVASAPDLGAELVTLTRNAMSYSMISRALSSQLGLYSTVIAEGKNG